MAKFDPFLSLDCARVEGVPCGNLPLIPLFNFPRRKGDGRMVRRGGGLSFCHTSMRTRVTDQTIESCLPAPSLLKCFVVTDEL